MCLNRHTMCSKWIKLLTWNFIYHYLGVVNISFNRICQFLDSRKINLIFMDQQSGHELTRRLSWWVLLCRIHFSMKLWGLMSKAIKLLLTELVGQCRNILLLPFSALTSLRSVNYGKCCGQYIPALTSHSVNKSIVLLILGLLPALVAMLYDIVDSFTHYLKRSGSSTNTVS